MNRLTCIAITITAGLTINPRGFSQGDLTPPGPPGPLFKTLHQVEPRTPIDSRNGDMGFVANSGVTLTECVAQGNGDAGFFVVATCVISRCVSRDNEGDGINAAAACTIDHCSVLGNRNDGIDAAQRGHISDCVVMNNGRRLSTLGLGVGIRMMFAGMVKHCVVDFNGGAAILLTGPVDGGGGATHVLENEITNNANQGVFVQAGGGNRIEGNSFIANSGPAIQNLVGGNLVIKNNALGNFMAPAADDYDFHASDMRGPVITGPGAIAAGANPWANFVQ